MPTEEPENEYDFGADQPGVPRGEGESWGDLAARIREEERALAKSWARAWFLSGFAASGEGFNPDILSSWDEDGHPVMDRFEAMYPVPDYADAVTTLEERAAFARRVQEAGGLFALLPKIDVTEEGVTDG